MKQEKDKRPAPRSNDGSCRCAWGGLGVYPCAAT